jgi:hypothetical protein
VKTTTISIEHRWAAGDPVWVVISASNYSLYRTRVAEVRANLSVSPATQPTPSWFQPLNGHLTPEGHAVSYRFEGAESALVRGVGDTPAEAIESFRAWWRTKDAGEVKYGDPPPVYREVGPTGDVL